MKDLFNRRKFLKNTAAAATGMALLSSLPKKSIAGFSAEPKIRFSVIGINHGHISGMVNAVTRGGGELVAVYAKEPDLLANFTRQFPKAKVARVKKRSWKTIPYNSY
jgi:hypothetical protein